MKIQHLFYTVLATFVLVACSSSNDELEVLVNNREFTKAAKWIQQNPDKDADINSMINVARFYRERVEFDVSQSILELVISKDSGNVPGRLLLANVYREQTKYNQALAIYQKLVIIDSVRFIILPERARLYTHLNEFDKAETDIREAKSLQPKYYASFLADGLLHYAKGDFEHALDLFDIAENLDPGLSAEASLYAGYILLKSNINYDAMGKFSRAVEVGRNINKGYAFINRGVCQINISDTAFACVDWDSAMVYMPDQAQTYIDKYCKNFR